MSENSMKKKKAERREADELRPEYDFATMKGGVRGKYVERYRAGTNLALLEPDVAEAFPTYEAVNDALRTILKAAAGISRAGTRATQGRTEANRRGS